MPINSLNAPIHSRNQEFRVHELLYSQYDTIFAADTNSSPEDQNMRADMRNMYVSTHPEFSTALLAYST